MIIKAFTVVYALATLLPGTTIHASQSKPASTKPVVNCHCVQKPPSNKPVATLPAPTPEPEKPLEPVAQAPQAASNVPAQQTPASANSGDVVALIYKWAAYYGISGDYLLHIAQCESSLNPNNVNYNYTAGGGHPSGVFQFLPTTFARYATLAGIVNPYIFNADNNVQAAAYAFSHGGAGEWECK